MYLGVTKQHIFYTAGKCGTQTLKAITGLREICPYDPALSLSLRKTARRELERTRLQQDLPVVCIIRNPEKRLISGLFQVLAKQLFGTVFYTIINNNYGEQRFVEYAEVLYDERFWNQAIERYLRATSPAWNPNAELESHRAQYHYGNWLADVQEIKATVPDCTIVDTEQLSEFLKNNGYEHEPRNTADYFIYAMYLDNKELRQHYDSLLDIPRMTQAFRAGWNSQLPEWSDKVNKYLIPEIQRYKDLVG